MAGNKSYPRNLKDEIKAWIQSEGFIAKYHNKSNLYNWAVIQFIIEKLELYNERCKNNPNIFTGEKVQLLFGVKAISTAGIIYKSIKLESTTEEEDLQPYIEQIIGHINSRVFQGCFCQRYYISKQLRKFIRNKIFQYRSKNALQTNSDFPTYHLNDLVQIFNVIFSEERHKYFERLGDNKYHEEVILVKNTDLFQVFNMDALETIDLPILLTKHMHIEKNLITEEDKTYERSGHMSRKIPKYKFENYIRRQATPEDKLRTHLFEKDARCSLTFLQNVKRPTLKINTYKLCNFRH